MFSPTVKNQIIFSMYLWLHVLLSSNHFSLYSATNRKPTQSHTYSSTLQWKFYRLLPRWQE